MDGGEDARWEKRGYRIEGATASLVFTDSGTVDRTDWLWDAADALTEECPPRLLSPP